MDAADTDPETWPRWLSIAASLLFLWAAFWWCVPRFSPISIVQSRIDHADAVQQQTRGGAVYYIYTVSFHPSAGNTWSGPFEAPWGSLAWPTTVDATYSYRKWDRLLLSFRTVDNSIAWQNLDLYYSGRVFFALCAGVVLFLVTYLLTRDTDTSLHFTN